MRIYLQTAVGGPMLVTTTPASGRGYLKSRRLDLPVVPASDTLKSAYRHSLSSLLAEKEKVSDRERLGSLVRETYQFAQDPSGRAAVADWLTKEGPGWLEHGYPALGAMVELGALLGLSQTSDLILKILERDGADAVTVSVAAQRVRLVPSDDIGVRRRTFVALQRRIETWQRAIETEADAITALPSVPHVGGEEAVPWLCTQIATGSPEICRAAALGILDWAVGSTRSVARPSKDNMEQIGCSLMDRIKLEENLRLRTGKNPLPVLVWTLGGVATEGNMALVASVLARVFSNPSGLSEAGAVQGGRLLLRTHGELGLKSLERAFDDAPEIGQQYLAELKIL